MPPSTSNGTPEIELTIHKDGTTTFKVIGLKGAGCLTATKQVEAALGAVTRRLKSAEYYEDEERPRVRLGTR